VRILLVEDDDFLTRVLLESFKNLHYTVDRAADGRSGWEYAISTTYDLLLIDVGLPGLDGISLCQRLRSEGCTTPILLMTAREAREERIRGFDAGADDYLLKPLDLDELHARARALLRREKVIPTPVLEAGKLRLDPARGEVTHEGRSLKLTPKEYKLLEIFLRNPSRLFSRGQLVEYLWTFDDPPLEESVKAHVKGLRQKLKPLGLADLIENVYGMGYRFNPPRETEPPPFDRAMADLWERYRGLMGQRLAVLQGAAREVRANSLSPATRTSARQAAHKLAGVLGMFGREEGTELAREIEELFESDRTADIPALVARLSDLLPVTAIPTPIETRPTTSTVLLIESDRSLTVSLQEFPGSEPVTWHCFPEIESACSWLSRNSPDVVAIGIGQGSRWELGLALIGELAARSPVVPTLVLLDGEELSDRLAVVRAGGRKILDRPVTAERVREEIDRMLRGHLRESFKILAIDDDPVILGALPALLEPWGALVTGLENPLDFREKLASTSPDLLLLDVEMPGVTGIDLCLAIRADPRWQDLPILFLTASRDPSTIERMFAAGGDDYITKPVISRELLNRVTRHYERARLPRILAKRDPLAGVLNQPACERELEEQIAGGRGFTLATIAAVDLDRIHRLHGHSEGNRVLQYWGNFLRSRFPAGETIGYWGYGEFILGLPELDKIGAGEYLSDILRHLRRQVFTAPDGERYQVEARRGFATYPADGSTLRDLYRVARGDR
jgi:diguanylate cyclase (GGDEF)-like protein